MKFDMNCECQPAREMGATCSAQSCNVPYKFYTDLHRLSRTGAMTSQPECRDRSRDVGSTVAKVSLV